VYSGAAAAGRLPDGRRRACNDRFTQDQLAAASNMSRYPTGELLRDLERQQLVSIGYRSVTIISPIALRMADGRVDDRYPFSDGRSADRNDR
jgi:hypothetical protein